jgi:hypothetical protein
MGTLEFLIRIMKAFDIGVPDKDYEGIWVSGIKV